MLDVLLRGEVGVESGVAPHPRVNTPPSSYGGGGPKAIPARLGIGE